jgi:hypothetical protein
MPVRILKAAAASPNLREPTGPTADLGTKPGLLPRQRIRALIHHRKMVQAPVEIEEGQIQPASLDSAWDRRRIVCARAFFPD